MGKGSAPSARVRDAAKERIQTYRWRAANPERYRASRKRWEIANRERNAERMRAWREANPERWKEICRRAAERQREKKLRMRERQGKPKPECCEVCGASGILAWDHDHATGAFRGWLCHGCNLSIGNAKDDPAILRKLADYLEERNHGKG